MDARTLASWRMHTLRLAGDRPYASPEAVVRGLLAVQAEIKPQAAWAVATRTTGATAPDITRLLDDGAILRTHVLRSTWHFVQPDDIRWLVELTAPRVRRAWDLAQKQLGISPDDLQRAIAIIENGLQEDGPLDRTEIAQRLAHEGLPFTGQALGMVLASAEQDVLICSGPGDTYALLEQRAPHARPLERDEALAEIALRYFTGHGPATVHDLAYWATLTITDIRRGIAAAGDRLQKTEHDGSVYWSAGGPPDDVDRLEPRAHLLQILDEYYRGYQDSRDLLDLAGIVPRERLSDVGMVLVDGQMVGGMKRTVRDGEVRFDIRMYRELDAGERQAVAEAADRYGEFLGRSARVGYAPA